MHVSIPFFEQKTPETKKEHHFWGEVVLVREGGMLYYKNHLYLGLFKVLFVNKILLLLTNTQ